MSQSAQLSLFETEPRKKLAICRNYYRALEEDVLQEALEVSENIRIGIAAQAFFRALHKSTV